MSATLSRQQVWYQAHRVQEAEKGRLRREANRIAISTQKAGHYQQNKEAIKARSAIRRKTIRNFVDSHKSKPCMDCGRTFPTVCMDFDHRDSKNDNVATMVAEGRPLVVIKAEIEKCDLVCSNCHRIRTAKRLGKVL